MKINNVGSITQVRINDWKIREREREKIMKMSALPITVIEGFNLPSFVNKEGISSLAKGLLGLGSFGVPSTLVQAPITLFQPTILYRMQQ